MATNALIDVIAAMDRMVRPNNWYDIFNRLKT